MKGIVIKQPWIDLIFDGKKTWEIRSKTAKIRGKIALIQSGSGLVIGTVELADSKELSFEEYQRSGAFHAIEDTSIIKYKKIHAWVLQNAVRFETPIPYTHPQGAVIWVNLVDFRIPSDSPEKKAQ